jgi:SAM-dependent methyltransferase
VIGCNGAPGFDAEFFPRLAAIEERHFWFAARNSLITWVLERFFPEAQSFLDVGSGTGQVIAALRPVKPAMQFTAAEPFEDGLRILARRVPDAELVQVDARRLPFDAEFDVAGAFDVIEHVDDHEAVIREMARSVRPGGGIILTVPQHQFLWSPLDDYARHIRRYARRDLVRLVQGAGLDVLRVTSFVSLLLPTLIVSRAMQRNTPVDPWSEFRVSPLVNAIGRTVMDVERWLIRMGISLPMGGSLLAVARRQ